MTAYIAAIAALVLAVFALFSVILAGLALWIHARAYVELQNGRLMKIQADARDEVVDASAEALDEIEQRRRLNRQQRTPISDEEMRVWAAADVIPDEEGYPTTDDNAVRNLDEGEQPEIPPDQLYRESAS